MVNKILTRFRQSKDGDAGGVGGPPTRAGTNQSHTAAERGSPATIEPANYLGLCLSVTLSVPPQLSSLSLARIQHCVIEIVSLDYLDEHGDKLRLGHSLKRRALPKPAYEPAGKP